MSNRREPNTPRVAIPKSTYFDALLAGVALPDDESLSLLDALRR